MTKQDMQGQYAGFVTRLGAWMIDRGIVAVVLGAVAWLVSYLLGIFGMDMTQCSIQPNLYYYACTFASIGLGIFAIIFGPLYMMVFWTLSGATPGKVVAGVRIVRMDGKPMTFRRSFRRWLGYLMSFFALGAGFLLILIDNRRQGWDDKFAGTCVVYSWKARQNETLIQRMTKKLFWGQKRIDHYSEELRGKSIYGTDSLQTTTSETDSTPDAGGDGAGMENQDAASKDAGASPEGENTTT